MVIMKCSYGISARLPSFFDRKNFSCSQGCLTRNVGDIGEEESLIIEGVQETLQKTLLERSLNVQTLSDRIINVLENSHIKDDIGKNKLKHPQSRKKMKRRKKRKPPTKCDIIRECDVIREGEIHAHAQRGLALFENEYLLNHVTKCDSYISSKDSTYSYDNNSYVSHCTSEKESAYSEVPQNSTVRKRKKLQRRKKRKPKMKVPVFPAVPGNEHHVIGNVVGTDNNSFDEDEGSFSVDIPSCNQIAISTPKSQARVTNFLDLNSTSSQITENSHNNKNNSNSNYDNNNNDKENILACSYNLKAAPIQTRNIAKFADIYKITKITDSDTTLDCENIDKTTKIVGKDEFMNGSYTNIVGDISLPTNAVTGGQFSKEQKRQLRRKMRNVKKRPESYVVLGCI